MSGRFVDDKSWRAPFEVLMITLRGSQRDATRPLATDRWEISPAFQIDPGSRSQKSRICSFMMTMRELPAGVLPAGAQTNCNGTAMLIG